MLFSSFSSCVIKKIRSAVAKRINKGGRGWGGSVVSGLPTKFPSLINIFPPKLLARRGGGGGGGRDISKFVNFLRNFSEFS